MKTLKNIRFRITATVIGVLGLSTALVQGAVINLDFLAQDNQFNNGTTVTGAPTFTVASTTGIGTPTYTINYTYTTDLSAYGQSPTSSFNFSLVVTTTDGNIPNTSTVGASNGGNNNLNSGESFTASLSFTPTGPWTGVTFGAIQSYGPGDMQVTTVSTGYNSTLTGANPVFNLTGATDYTITNVDAGTDLGNVGFMQFHVLATIPTPEPSSLGLFAIGAVLIGRTRKRIA